MKKLKKLSLKKEMITNLKESEMNTLRGGASDPSGIAHCYGPTCTSEGGTSTCICPSANSYCPGNPTYGGCSSGTIVTTGGATCGAYC